MGLLIDSATEPLEKEHERVELVQVVKEHEEEYESISPVLETVDPKCRTLAVKTIAGEAGAFSQKRRNCTVLITTKPEMR